VLAHYAPDALALLAVLARLRPFDSPSECPQWEVT
jgi:hypothetical protein